jgi:hypothetical protein
MPEHLVNNCKLHNIKIKVLSFDYFKNNQFNSDRFNSIFENQPEIMLYVYFTAVFAFFF